jgi:GH25 family lysozyme M1 (1,4-beta-N-acetylmuramidase)
MTKPIIDISYHQPPGAINYDQLAGAVDGVILRAAYGTGVPGKWQGTEPAFDRHYAEFTKRGIHLGVYHYIVEYEPIEKQVMLFLDAVRGKNLKLGYWCDVELEDGADRLTAKSVIGWMDGVEANRLLMT